MDSDRQVRRHERFFTGEDDNWGNWVRPEVADTFKGALQQYLATAGFISSAYHGNGQPEAVAYSTVDAAFRKEPVLVDDGGTLFRFDIDGRPALLKVLKIAVRDAGGSNAHLHRGILELLRSYGITNPEKGWVMGPAPGTEVYALKRTVDDSDLKSERKRTISPVHSEPNPVPAHA